MGYWTCWMEQVRALAPKHLSAHAPVHHTPVHHAPLHHAVHHSVGSHAPVHHVGHHVAAKVGGVTLKKVCVWTGVIGAGWGGVAPSPAQAPVVHHPRPHISSPVPDAGGTGVPGPGIGQRFLPYNGDGYVGIPGGGSVIFTPRHNDVVVEDHTGDYVVSHNGGGGDRTQYVYTGGGQDTSSSINNVPEPSSLAVLALGVSGLLIVARRSVKKSS